MRSIPQAMIWETLRRGSWKLLASVLAANLMPVLVLSALRMQGAVEPDDSSMIVMHFVMVQINAMIFGAAVFEAQGQPARLYAFPVTNASLVLWQMMPAMWLVAVESVASAAFLNAAFGLGWPLWGPAMFAAVAVATIQSMLWLGEKSAWLPWLLGLVGLVLGLWNKSRYGAMFSQPTQLWREVTPLDVATLMLFAAVAYVVGVVAVARNRRGDSLPAWGILAWCERVFDRTSDVDRAFQNPADAQFWFEWRKKGWAMPAIVGFCLVIGVSGWLISNRNPQELIEGFVAGGAMLSFAGFVGVFLGNAGSNDADFALGHFQATRPMTCPDMAKAVLKMSAKSVFVAWSIWAVAFGTVFVILFATRALPQPALPNKIGWWYFPVTLLGPWVVVTSFASISLTGRSQLVAKIIFGGLVVAFADLVFSKFVLPPQARSYFGQGMVVAVGGACLLGTAWAFMAARRRSLIEMSTIYFAAGTWLLLTVLSVSALLMLEKTLHPALPWPAYVFGVGLLALAVAPFATAPLALAWNRSR